MPRSTVSDGEGSEADRVSLCSTIASTTSLTARLEDLTLNFKEKFRRVHQEPPLYEGEEVDDDEEEVVEISEEQLMQELDGMEPSLQVCARLFRAPAANVMCLKRLTASHFDELRHKGYVVIDNYVSREIAARSRSEVLNVFRQGKFQEAAHSSAAQTREFTDRSARGDHILWLHPGRHPAAPNSHLMSLVHALQELQGDLRQMMHLRQQSAEYQLSVYPYNGAQYVRHRDAFPDDGSEGHQRRVTAILYANPGWSPSDGGKLRLWPPPMIDSAAAGAASVHCGHLPVGTSPRAAVDRSFSGSTENAAQHFSGCNGVASGPLGLPGRLSGPEPGCSSLDRESLPSTASEAPSGSSDDRRLNGGTHQAGVMQSSHANGCTNGSASEHLRLAASANGLAACLQAQLHANGNGHGPIANGAHAGLGSDLGSEAANTASHAGELEHEHSACNGYLADGDSGLYGHHQEASPANGHLHPLRLEPMLQPHFNRQGSMASSMVAEATEASVLDSVQDGASSIDDGGSMDGASARKRAAPVSVKQTEIGTEAVVDVAPLAGRLVLFLSGAVEHAVLPNFAQRVALTAWCQ